jgi:hypothetical protein
LRTRDRALLFWVCGLFAALCMRSGELYAQAPTAQEAPKAARVALLGPYIYVDPLSMAIPQISDTTWAKGQLAGHLRHGAARYGATHGEALEFVDVEGVKAAIQRQPGYSESLDRARQQAELGLQRYKELDTRAAIPLLERALERYRASRHDLVAPQEVADVLLYLTLSTLEEAQSARPLEWMRALVLLDPERVVQKGYYPDSVVEFYQVARANILRELRQRGPGIEAQEDAAMLSELLSLDAAYLMTLISMDDGRYQVSLYPYQPRARRFDAPESLIIDELTPDGLREAGDMLLSRFDPCHRPVIAPSGPVGAASGDSPWSVDLHFSYASFLKYPDPPLQTPYGNYGVGLGVLWRLTEEFGLVGRAQVLIAQKDRNGLLITEDFSTLRAFVGADLSLTFFDELTVGVQIAGDLTRISEFEAWPTPGCAANPGDPICLRTRFDEFDLLFGLNARPLISYNVYRTLSLTLSGSASYFFFGDGDAMNFPVSSELGVQYRF